jgi:hypothetical protein
MTTKESVSNELKSTSYEVFIAVLSILSVFNLFWAVFTPYETVSTVLDVMNAVFTGIFIIDFTMRIFTANSKSRYLLHEYGWADLLACLPFQQTKIFRLFRVFRAYRLTKKHGLKNMAREVVADRAQSVLLTLLLAGVFVFEFGSLAMLTAESTAPNANITNASDALWYTIVTISTVGYGDKYPVTNAGRIVGSCIIVTGVGIFGTFTGYLANWFLSPKKEKATQEEQPGPEDRPQPNSPVAGDDGATGPKREKV